MTSSRLTPPPQPPLSVASQRYVSGVGMSEGVPGVANVVPTPPERPPQSRASEVRRATKPIMEKRRRARINQCLTELKALILDALNKDPSRHSKLEKADILEMTVRHLQNVQRHQMAAALSTDPAVMGKFRAGFAECANEVSRYVTRLESVEPALRQRLVGHLSTCVNGLSSTQPTSPLSSPLPPGLLISPLSVQIPGLSGDVNNNGAGGNNVIVPGPAGRLQLGGLPLIPSRLPNGDLAFVLPTVTSGGAPWGPPTPTNTSTPTSPHPPRSPSPASSFGSGLSPGGSDAGSDLSSEAPSSSTSYCPAGEELPQRPFRDMVRALERHQAGEHPGRDDSVWRPW